MMSYKCLYVKKYSLCTVVFAKVLRLNSLANEGINQHIIFNGNLRHLIRICTFDIVKLCAMSQKADVIG